MADINIAELATLGAQIAELGMKLAEMRARREAVNVEILAVEKDLLPLITKHAQLIASITGQVAQIPQVFPTVQAVPTALPGTPSSVTSSNPSKERIVQYLKRCEPGSSALEIAEQIHVDPTLVREVMADLRRGG